MKVKVRENLFVQAEKEGFGWSLRNAEGQKMRFDNKININVECLFRGEKYRYSWCNWDYQTYWFRVRGNKYTPFLWGEIKKDMGEKQAQEFLCKLVAKGLQQTLSSGFVYKGKGAF